MPPGLTPRHFLQGDELEFAIGQTPKLFELHRQVCSADPSDVPGTVADNRLCPIVLSARALLAEYRLLDLTDVDLETVCHGPDVNPWVGLCRSGGGSDARRVGPGTVFCKSPGPLYHLRGSHFLRDAVFFRVANTNDWLILAMTCSISELVAHFFSGGCAYSEASSMCWVSPNVSNMFFFRRCQHFFRC